MVPVARMINVESFSKVNRGGLWKQGKLLPNIHDMFHPVEEVEQCGLTVAEEMMEAPSGPAIDEVPLTTFVTIAR